MNDSRGPWFLLTGLIVGLAIGLLISWVVLPVEFIDTTPETLRADFKDEYRYLIANAYAVSGNLERARARLNLLGDPDSSAALREQAGRLLSAGASEASVNVLEGLAEALTAQPGAPESSDSSEVTPAVLALSPTTEAVPQTSPTPGLPTATSRPSQTPTPFLTSTPRPTRTPTPTQGAAFVLVNQSTFCRDSQPGLLRVFLRNAGGQPAPGVELIITWPGGQDNFFSGLKPEIDNGYADFVMQDGIEYILSMSNGSTRITGISPGSCGTESGDAYPGGVELIFEQP